MAYISDLIAMETILFYEKPGCQNNTKQKKILELSGYQVVAINLLDYPWTKEELSQYLGEKPAADCFNMAAPVIKSGMLDPFAYTKGEALEMMVKEPLLIKRPLMKIGDHYIQGFDMVVLRNLITLSAVQDSENIAVGSGINDLNSCPHIDNLSCTNQEK